MHPADDRHGSSAGVVRLATRGSPLALRQAELVAALLAREPGVVVEQVVVHTEGDRRTDEPLDRIGGQGLFVKEVQQAVIDRRADVAVHSAKDLPPVTPAGLLLAAVPTRADPRDALVGSTFEALPPGALVATGSARRRAQLANARPDLTFVELRGNMATRVSAAGRGSVAAVVVAAAAMERLGWTDRVAEVLAVSLMLPQVGQGALALECRADDRSTAALLEAVDDPSDHRCVVAERAFLGALGGSCAVPVGAWATAETDGRVRLRSMVASSDGRVVVRHEDCHGDPEVLGRMVARQLLEEHGGIAAGWTALAMDR